MSWECCNIKGECQRGPGCPAGACDRCAVMGGCDRGHSCLLKSQAPKQPECATAKPQAQRESCAPGMCESAPGCRDTACPSHPGLKWKTLSLRSAHQESGLPRLKDLVDYEESERISAKMQAMKEAVRAANARRPIWRRYLPDLIMWLIKALGALAMVAALTWWILSLMLP